MQCLCELAIGRKIQSASSCETMHCAVVHQLEVVLMVLVRQRKQVACLCEHDLVEAADAPNPAKIDVFAKLNRLKITAKELFKEILIRVAVYQKASIYCSVTLRQYFSLLISVRN